MNEHYVWCSVDCLSVHGLQDTWHIPSDCRSKGCAFIAIADSGPGYSQSSGRKQPYGTGSGRSFIYVVICSFGNAHRRLGLFRDNLAFLASLFAVTHTLSPTLAPSLCFDSKRLGHLGVR